MKRRRKMKMKLRTRILRTESLKMKMRIMMNPEGAAGDIVSLSTGISLVWKSQHREGETEAMRAQRRRKNKQADGGQQGTQRRRVL